MIQAYDNFLDSYQSIKDFSLSCEFKDEVNEVDGVTYPYICRDIPEDVRSEVFKKLAEFKGGEIENPTIFLRMSPGGVHVPHVAHTDISMGQFSFMLYLHDNSDSGTSLLRHRMTGISYSPMLDGFTKIIEGDMNNFDILTSIINERQSIYPVSFNGDEVPKRTVEKILSLMVSLNTLYFTKIFKITNF